MFELGKNTRNSPTAVLKKCRKIQMKTRTTTSFSSKIGGLR